jgi:hypothetical protein
VLALGGIMANEQSRRVMVQILGDQNDREAVKICDIAAQIQAVVGDYDNPAQVLAALQANVNAIIMTLGVVGLNEEQIQTIQYKAITLFGKLNLEAKEVQAKG